MVPLSTRRSAVEQNEPGVHAREIKQPSRQLLDFLFPNARGDHETADVP